VNLGCKLDLKTIALRARNAEYNPKVRPIFMHFILYEINRKYFLNVGEKTYIVLVSQYQQDGYIPCVS
jgi:hypothetical protein